MKEVYINEKRYVARRHTVAFFEKMQGTSAEMDRSGYPCVLPLFSSSTR